MSAGDRLLFLLATSCGLGLVPVAPGTFGTLGGVGLAVVLQQFLGGMRFAAALALVAAALLAIGCTMTGFSERTFGTTDPKAFVLDEVVGYLIALGGWVAFHGAAPLWGYAAAFVAFRVFDILKPYPVYRLEDVPGAPGVMLDDVAAGLYAAIVIVVLGYFVPL